MIYFFLNVLTNTQNGYSKCLEIFSLRCIQTLGLINFALQNDVFACHHDKNLNNKTLTINFQTLLKDDIVTHEGKGQIKLAYLTSRQFFKRNQNMNVSLKK